MITFAIGSFIATTFIIVERPTPAGVIYDYERICFWADVDGINAAVSPKGCYSTSCTSPKFQAGTAVVDRQNYKIELETRFVLVETSRFPLPCIENCAGGGTVHFKLGDLIPNDYEVWFRGKKVGELMIFSGLPTPRQCFDNTDEPIITHQDQMADQEMLDDPRSCFAQSKMPQISTQDVSEMDRSAIIGALFSQYLEQFLEPAIPDSYHLTSFAITEVSIDSTLEDLAQEYQVDWAGWVTYSVQAKDLDCWIAGNGVLGDDGWILDKTMIVGVTEVGNILRLTTHGTGP
jgi:hypothetical protein